MKIIATNRKARHDYHIIDTIEAGMVLHGSEVKSLREGKASIKEAYVRIVRNELFIIGMHIGEYSHAGYTTHTPVHDRKLLVHRKEILKLARAMDEKGMTLIPLRLYFNKNHVKLEVAIAKGKKRWDKRQDITRKDIKRDTYREMKKMKTFV